MRVDVIALLAIAILLVATFVAARTWGQVSLPASIGLLGLSMAQALWVLGIIPPVGQFGPRIWAAIACGMLVVLGFWLMQLGLKQRAVLAGLVSLGAAVELLILSGTLQLG